METAGWMEVSEVVASQLGLGIQPSRSLPSPKDTWVGQVR